MGAICLREFQNVFFDFGFVDQCVHGVLIVVYRGRFPILPPPKKEQMGDPRLVGKD